MISRNLLSVIKNKKNTIAFLVSTTMALGGIVVSYTQFIYELGIESQRNNTGVELGKIFEFRTKPLKEELDLNEKTVNFKNIYLVSFPDPVLEKQNQALYKIRKIVNTPEVTQEIGTILTEKQQNNTKVLFKKIGKKVKEVIVNLPQENFLIQNAYAQTVFNWYEHQDDYNFYEEYVDRSTIRRYYNDGWILEYKVDETGRSIFSTFRWIQKGNI